MDHLILVSSGKMFEHTLLCRPTNVRSLVVRPCEKKSCPPRVIGPIDCQIHPPFRWVGGWGLSLRSGGCTRRWSTGVLATPNFDPDPWLSISALSDWKCPVFDLASVLTRMVSSCRRAT